jgi:23S rRNA (cytidine1920-2'-O)/16S rRNA (cytidine1409-2'-O)-methyltransferase
MSGGRMRLDEALVERGLIETRSRARAFVLAGDVLVDGVAVMQAGKPVGPDQTISLREKQRFVSRGGEKLDHALREFAIDVAGAVCADFGASTGGFTDCLLSRGARRVYAIDVGYGQLHQRLREDNRVVVMERENVRLLGALPEEVSIVVVDVSFISLRLVFPAVTRVLRKGGWCVPLIKPQFEAGRKDIAKGGVVREPAVHRRIIEDVLAHARLVGLSPAGLTMSPLTGPAGNVEFLAALRFGGVSSAPVEQLLNSVGLDHESV